MKRGALIAGFILLALVGQALVPAAAAPGPDLSHPFRQGYVLVGYREGISPSVRVEVRGQAGVALERRLMPSADLLRLPAGLAVGEAIARLERDPRVAYAEPDYLVEASATSNDPYYTNGSLWGTYGDATTPKNDFGSQAGEAWAAGYTGSSSVVIGVIDEGIDISHPDLAANIWKNPGEVAGNGLDDDGNGYVDDVNGWDFYSNDNTVFDGSPKRGGDEHGTHVSGTIGAIGGNGGGVAGVNWNVTLISTKFLGPNGGSTSGAVSALQYLTNLKTRGTNPVNIVASSNSWGGGGYSSTLRDAMIAAGNAGILFVAAAGNSSVNADSSPQYPAAYTCPTTAGFDCVISVASITSSGALSSFSNYGATTIDLGAPGSSIYSTLPFANYGSYSGTSMATPHVSGAVALCASIGPSLMAGQLRSAVLGSVAPTTSLSGKTVTGGRLDVGAMVARCTGVETPVVTSSLTATVNLATLDGVSAAGTVTSSPGDLMCSGGTCVAELGGFVTLTATPQPGSRFTGWSGACSGTASTCTIVMDQAKTVTAGFAPGTFSASVSVTKPSRTSPTVQISTTSGTSWSELCGSTCSKTVVSSTSLVLVANTLTGATRVSWTGCTPVAGTSKPTCVVTVNAAVTVTAKFAK